VPLHGFLREKKGSLAVQGRILATGRHVFNAFFSPEIRVIDKFQVSASFYAKEKRI